MLGFLRKPPQEDVSITLPGVQLAFNHRLKICFLYEMDSSMPNDRYADLETHLNKQGYFLQVIVAASGVPAPLMQPRERE